MTKWLPGHYVVLKEHQSFQEAYEYWADIVKRFGHQASFGYSSRDDRYLCIPVQFRRSRPEAQIELDKTRLLELFEDAYSLEID